MNTRSLRLRIHHQGAVNRQRTGRMTISEKPAMPSDEYLTDSLRHGDTDAIGRLYSRHYTATLQVARAHSRDASSAADLTSAAFEATFNAIRKGAGPDSSFRAYVYTCVRRLAARESRRAQSTITGCHQKTFDLAQPSSAARPEWDVIARAFRQLPERWQSVIWYTVVEDVNNTDTARFMGLTPNGVSALVARALKGLRSAYFAEHTEPWHERVVQVKQVTCTSDRPAPKLSLSLAARGDHIAATATIGQRPAMKLTLGNVHAASATGSRGGYAATRGRAPC